MKTVITPTGYREKHFRILESYMQSQTYTGIRWIVVNDGPPLEFSREFDFETHMLNVDSSDIVGPTLGYNTLAAISHLCELGDWPTEMIMMEDDVWYAPTYIEYMCELMCKADIVGTAPAFVYNVAFRCWKIFKSPRHASWSETSVSGAAACTYLWRLCSRIGTMLDMNMWLKKPWSRRQRTNSHLEQLSKPIAVSMKGHGQSRTLGTGHVLAEVAGFEPDPDLTVLREWIGDNVENYYATPDITQ